MGDPFTNFERFTHPDYPLFLPTTLRKETSQTGNLNVVAIKDVF